MMTTIVGQEDKNRSASVGGYAASAEESTSEGERFFRELADNAPVMIWRSAPDKLCDWFSKPWLDFVGRTMGQEVGNGWAEGVHPDDFDRCLEDIRQRVRCPPAVLG